MVGSENRSGLNWSGLGYWVGSLLIALELRADLDDGLPETDHTHHIFPKLIFNKSVNFE